MEAEAVDNTDPSGEQTAPTRGDVAEFEGYRQELDQLEQQLSQLQVLHRIGIAMTSTIRASEIMRLVLSEISNLTQAESATMYLADYQLHQLVPQLSVGHAAVAVPIDLVSGDDLIAEAAHTGILKQAELRDCPLGTSCDSDPTCRLAVPLVAGEEVLGVIDIRAAQSVCYDEHITDLLSTLAAQTAQVLRNASTHEEVEQRYREMSLLYEIQQEIVSTFDYNTVLRLIVQRTKRLLNGCECTIRLLTQRNGQQFLTVAATTASVIGPEEVPFEESAIDSQVLSGTTIFIEDVRTDPRFRFPDDAGRAGFVSMLCAPLLARRKTIGTIRLYTSERREFSISDRKMLLAVAGQAATAIENTRLYQQVEAKNQELSASYKMLAETQRELVRKERLAALGEMAAVVAHEIRNPLTSIRGFAQRIQRHSTSPEDRIANYTGIIMEEVDRLNKFIKDVLDFARHVKPAFEEINVNVVLRDVLNLMRDELVSHNITVVPDLDMNLPQTVVDSSLIKQMLLNVLQNARQALERGGIMMIKTQQSGRFLRIRITDNGCGISRNNLQKIWSPFFTTKTLGTGLGLSLAQRIIDDHHGRILLRSRAGYGTIVDIFLPIVDSEQELLGLR